MVPDSSDPSPSLELGRFAQILRRRWKVPVAGALLGLLVGVTIQQLNTPEYTASSQVNLNVITTDPFTVTRSASDFIDTQTEVQTAQSTAVTTRVAQAVGRSTADVRDSMTATLLPEGTVMRLSYSADSADAAVTGADALATALVDYRAEAATNRLDTIVAQLTTRRDGLREQLTIANRRLARAQPGSSAATQADTDRQLLNIELDSLLTQVNALGGVDTAGGTVLASAEDRSVYISPRPAVVLLSALAVGLVLGIIGAFVANVLDRRVRDAYDVDGAGAGPLLAEIGSRSRRDNVAGRDIDAVRSLRERLLANLPTELPILSVADVSRQDHPSDLAVDLAVAMAESGVPVTLVLAEFPADLTAQIWQRLGLAAGAEPQARATTYRGDDYPGLRIVVPTPGPDGVDPSTGYIGALLERGGTREGLTILALPPRASRSLVLTAGRLGHSFVLVARDRDTRIEQLAGYRDELRDVGARVHGTVLDHRGPIAVDPPSAASTGAARDESSTAAAEPVEDTPGGARAGARSH